RGGSGCCRCFGREQVASPRPRGVGRPQRGSRWRGTLPSRTPRSGSTSVSEALHLEGHPMTSEMLTTPTSNSLQHLGEADNDRLGGASRLFFEDQSFTGLQLAERARRLSQGFRDAGLKPGERVVVCMANCPEVGLTYNAVWRAGAANTPVLFLLSEDELRHVLSDSEAAYIVTTPEFLAKTVAAATGVGSLRGVIVLGSTEGVSSSVPLLDFA